MGAMADLFGGHMVNAEREPITGAWGRAPSGVQGQKPWSGTQGGFIPEAENFFAFVGLQPGELANLS